MALDESLRTRLSDLIASHRVVLFMKGTRAAPQCGFSAQVVRVLDDLLPSYETVNVLESQELRDGIKEFSNWPTIPQLYIDAQFIGGSDIVRELSASGELPKLLGAAAAEPKVPAIRLSDAAAESFREALEDARGEFLRLSIDAQFEHDLFFGPRAPGDLEVDANGIRLLIDRASARRADGTSIDFIAGPQGGFKITNPNQPARVRELAATDVKAMLDRGELTLFDVRPEAERALASIAGAHPLDQGGRELLMSLDRSRPVAFHCHHGIRSRGVAEQAVREGFKDVYNLKGGIEAWSSLVDSGVPRY